MSMTFSTETNILKRHTRNTNTIWIEQVLSDTTLFFNTVTSTSNVLLPVMKKSVCHAGKHLDQWR